jgi:hypothetical protein
MENRDDQNKNQTGQQGQQGFGQGQQPTGQEGKTGSDQGAFGKSGTDTTLAQGQKSEFDKQRLEEEGSDKGFVGTSEEDTSESLVETGQSDFAESGQGATARTGTASNEDIETGTSATRDATLDDGS